VASEAGGNTKRLTLGRNDVHDQDSPTAWMAEGNCQNHPPTTFFPPDGVGVDRAKKICIDCPVAAACLAYALEHRIDHGVWGGTSERERRRMLKTRKVLSLTGRALR
jgi:WhiB family transcriptional regulator, redox-sensing transcriptional regulator